MSFAESTEVADLLREIRDGQRLALERQSEALAMQREQIALVKQQFDRAERINLKAEALQDRAAKGMRVVVFVLIPLAAIGIVVLLWR